MSFFSDLFSGNFAKAESDLTKGINSLPPWAKSFVTTLESDAGQLLSLAVNTAAQDVIKGGLTTASFKSAANDVAAKLTAQGTTMGTQIIYSALNAAVAEAATVTPAS
jgi:hypothetical protein